MTTLNYETTRYPEAKLMDGTELINVSLFRFTGYDTSLWVRGDNEQGHEVHAPITNVALLRSH